MNNDLIVKLIIGAAVILAVLILVLLIKKFIKAILALVLIAIVGVAAYAGIKVLDNKTNIRKNVQSVDSAYQTMLDKRGGYGLKSVQANFMGKDVGITVVYTVDAESSDTLTETLLNDTRAVLLNAARYADMVKIFEAEDALPQTIRVGIKYKKLDIVYYKAQAAGTIDVAAPDASYGSFKLLLDTGAQPSGTPQPLFS